MGDGGVGEAMRVSECEIEGVERVERRGAKESGK
jgi:hypothetical protein